MTLSARLKELKLPQGRLKTGTPPRLDGRTIDYRQARRATRRRRRPGRGRRPAGLQLPRRSAPASAPGVVLDHADQRAHARDHPRRLRRAARCSPGVIDGVGPRYCPSIEDKVNRFAGKDSHQIFLEPEGLTTHEVYPNGISTSLPFDVQLEAVRSIAGLEYGAHRSAGLRDRVRLLRSARAAAELRDAGDRGTVLRRADQRHDRLRRGRRAGSARRASTRRCKAHGRVAWVPTRDQAYLGVLIDDLVIEGRDRAVPHVHQPRRVPAAAARGQRRSAPDRGRAPARARSTTSVGTCSRASASWFHVKPARLAHDADPGHRRRVWRAQARSTFSLLDLLRRPGRDLRPGRCRRGAGPARQFHVKRCATEAGRQLADQVIEQIETATRYAGYIEKQSRRGRACRAERIDADSTATSTSPRFARCRSKCARRSTRSARRRSAPRRGCRG